MPVSVLESVQIIIWNGLVAINSVRNKKKKEKAKL